jgi:tRNA threonylcarbamoyl adenosine modification protein (Sua5/YciO/YrdC/YwlC family)
MILKINPKNPQPRLIRKVAEVLNNGGLVGYPTDTIYGIGCDLFNKKAIARIYDIKGKDRHKPLSFICADLKDISKYAKVTNYAYKSMKKLLPGPYTFILEATHLVPKIMLTKRKTVGIRVPDNPISLSIIRELGHPIISTSVTKPNEQLFNDPEEIHQTLKGKLDLVIDGDRIVAEHSTIVDLTEEIPNIVRKGKGDIDYFSFEKEPHPWH